MTESICPKCGYKLNDDQDFCPKCGTAKIQTQKECPKCGALMSIEHDFCTKCGQRLNGSIAKKTDKKSKKILRLIGIIFTIVVIIAVIIKVLFLSLRDYEDYLGLGEYEKAYEKTRNEDERLAVLCENAAAKVSYSTLDLLKDPSSFVLRNAFYLRKLDDDGEYIYCLVLQINANNSFGASTNSYWFYEYDGPKNQWSYWTSVTDLEQEEFQSWDDYYDEYEKIYRNLVRECISETMLSGVKLSEEGVGRINTMFESDTLKNVELLDAYDDAGTSLN